MYVKMNQMLGEWFLSEAN